MNLPTVDALMEHKERPILLEVTGGSELICHHIRIFYFCSILELPRACSPVVSATAFTTEERGPALENVLLALQAHGVEVDSHSLSVCFKATSCQWSFISRQ
jgi:hypothetical protein